MARRSSAAGDGLWGLCLAVEVRGILGRGLRMFKRAVANVNIEVDLYSRQFGLGSR